MSFPPDPQMFPPRPQSRLNQALRQIPSDFGTPEHFWKNSWKISTNFSPTLFQPTPTDGENFLVWFCIFTNFFKNAPEHPNHPKPVREPNTTHSTIREKNIRSSGKNSSLFPGPLRFRKGPIRIENQGT